MYKTLYWPATAAAAAGPTIYMQMQLFFPLSLTHTGNRHMKGTRYWRGPGSNGGCTSDEAAWAAAFRGDE